MADLTARIEAGRIDLGDQATGIIGAGTREIGSVSDPVPLSSIDPDDPTTMAEYDLADRG